jgi:hypothetical protein
MKLKFTYKGKEYTENSTLSEIAYALDELIYLYLSAHHSYWINCGSTTFYTYMGLDTTFGYNLKYMGDDGNDLREPSIIDISVKDAIDFITKNISLLDPEEIENFREYMVL